MPIEIDLTGKVVLVTGGARGVGRGVAAQFRQAGARVEICGRSDASDIVLDDAGIVYRQLDVRDADAVGAWVDDIVERHGRIDVVVNNAGGSPFGAFEEGSARYMRALTDLNFLSAAFVSSAAHPHLAVNPHGGSVINITSISARRPSPGTAVYGAAKAALESLTGSLAVEWAPNVRVNAVSCGLVATEAAESHYGDAEQYARVAATIPRGRLADPLEIGWACVMLAAPHSSHITGAVVDVDGGGEWPAFLTHTPNGDFVTRAQGATP